MISRYNRAANRWTKMIERLGYASAYRELISEYASDKADQARVLDIGCGSGAFAEAYLDAIGSVKSLTLADPSPAMLENAFERLKPRAEVTRIEASIGATLTTHDVILCAHVLDHCHDLPKALKTLADCMSTDGQMIIVHTKPHWCNWLIWPQWTHISRTPEEFLAAVKGAGLTCIAHRGFAAGPPSRTSHAYIITH